MGKAISVFFVLTIGYFMFLVLIALGKTPIKVRKMRTNEQIHDSIQYAKMEQFVSYVNDSCYVINKRDRKIIKNYIHE
jgi:hypothetical protein